MKARWEQDGEHHLRLVDADGKVLANVTTAWGFSKAHLPLFKDAESAKSAVERAVGAEVL